MGNRIKGKTGEEIAAKYLKKKGYRILHRNYKTDLGEIDLIVTDDDRLVFVEVKSRTGEQFGEPAEAVTYQKQRKISQVAAQFITRHMLRGVAARFDVVEVFLAEDRIRHIEDAFDSYLRF